VLAAEKKHTEVVKAAEKTEADAKEHARLVSQCEELIDSYHPRKKSGKLDYPERDSSVAKWKASLAEAKKRSVENMRSYTKSLVATVAKRYADQERASERM